MQRQSRATRGRPPRPVTRSGLVALWVELLRPALVIAFAGFAAVIYISLCARVSIMEWDLCTLEQRGGEVREQCLALQREIAEARKSSLIRDHVARHHLTANTATAQVVIDTVPRELLPELSQPTDEVQTELASITPPAAGGNTLIAAAPPRR